MINSPNKDNVCGVSRQELPKDGYKYVYSPALLCLISEHVVPSDPLYSLHRQDLFAPSLPRVQSHLSTLALISA